MHESVYNYVYTGTQRTNNFLVIFLGSCMAKEGIGELAGMHFCGLEGSVQVEPKPFISCFLILDKP